MDNPLYRQIGERLRQAREAMGASQEEIARQLGYSSPATISHFESGQRKISIADLQELAQSLGVSLDYLIGQSGSTQMSYFRSRAARINPIERENVATFLSFASAHSHKSAPAPAHVRNLKPGQAAAKILAEVGIDAPPVSPGDVARHYQISLFDWDFPDEISGMILIEHGAVSIGVNSNHPNVRQRFTTAHEVGHYALHGQDMHVDFVNPEIGVLTSDDQESQEKQANFFAADLLMPKDWIQADFAEHGEAGLKYLSQRYGVSEQALWFRLLNLRLVSAA